MGNTQMSQVVVSSCNDSFTLCACCLFNLCDVCVAFLCSACLVCALDFVNQQVAALLQKMVLQR